MADSLSIAGSDAEKLEPHLPPRRPVAGPDGTRDASLSVAPGSSDAWLAGSARPFVTLTFAMSLDASLALTPGQQLALSGPESKAMTHYLRSRHDAICVGVGTAIADDPGLNCRIAGVGLGDQPRPFIIDPHARWRLHHDSRVMRTARAGLGLAPYILTAVQDPPKDVQTLLEEHGGKYILLDRARPQGGGVDTARNHHFAWPDILAAMYDEDVRSVMIEGGAGIINELIEPAAHHLVDSVVVTLAPTWLGQGGVVVSPARTLDENGHAVPAARLTDVAWFPFGADMVLCGKIGH